MLCSPVSPQLISMCLLSAPPFHSRVLWKFPKLQIFTFSSQPLKEASVKWTKEFCHHELQWQHKPLHLNSTTQLEEYFWVFFFNFYYLKPLGVSKGLGGLKHKVSQKSALSCLPFFDIFSRRIRLTVIESYFNLVFPTLGSAELWGGHSKLPVRLLHLVLRLFVLCANFYQGQNATQNPI